MMDFNIQYGRSTEIFIDGQLNPNLIIEEGCWYLCLDTAELFIGVATEDGLTLKRINEAIINQIPVKDLALKSEVETVKQEVIQTVIPEVEEVKTKIEEELAPVVYNAKEIAGELKTWVENKEYLQDIDLDGYATQKWIEDQGYLTELPDLSNFVTTETVNNITTQIQNIEQNYITNEKVTEIVTEKVSIKVDEQVESKVADVIQDKVNTGEIAVAVDKITYGEF